MGDVFYSVKRESDFGANIFNGPLADTALSRRLRDIRKLAFVDFEFYEPSNTNLHKESSMRPFS